MQVAPGAWRYAVPPLAFAPIVALLWVPPVALALVLLAAFVLAFFRDPERTPPEAGVVSPADGTVSVLRDESGRVRLGVFMNVWHVHVVRAPAGGTVTTVEHTPGANRPAFSKDSDRNERVHVRFDTDGNATAEDADTATNPDAEATNPDSRDTGQLDGSPHEVTLIAGAFARRIAPYVDDGERVDRGARIGHIAFGSRVDVLFPPEISIDDVCVEPGDRVRAGETVILAESA